MERRELYGGCTREDGKSREARGMEDGGSWGWMGGSEGAVGVWQKAASSLAAKVCPSLSAG